MSNERALVKCWMCGHLFKEFGVCPDCESEDVELDEKEESEEDWDAEFYE